MTALQAICLIAVAVSGTAVVLTRDPLRQAVSSGVLGVAMDITPASNDAAFVVVEPGQHGFELSAGYLRLLGQLGTGYSLRASVLRTDGEPWKANPNATYVGAEAQWTLVFVAGGRAGVYRRVSGTSGEHDVLATVGLSIGL